MVGAAFGPPESSALAGNHCSGTDAVIKERKSHLQKEGELEKERRRRTLDFLDILLFARVSVDKRGLSLWAEAHRKGIPALWPCLHRWRMEAACLTRTSVPKWTRSCSRITTPQPVASPLCSSLPPCASAEVPGRDPVPPGGWRLHHLVNVQEIEEPCPI